MISVVHISPAVAGLVLWPRLSVCPAAERPKHSPHSPHSPTRPPNDGECGERGECFSHLGREQLDFARAAEPRPRHQRGRGGRPYGLPTSSATVTPRSGAKRSPPVCTWWDLKRPRPSCDQGGVVSQRLGREIRFFLAETGQNIPHFPHIPRSSTRAVG